MYYYYYEIWYILKIELLGTLSNEDGNANDDGSEKHLFGSLFTSLWRSLGFYFFALNFVNRKTMEYFSMKLNKYWESFCCYVLVLSRTLKKVFSRCNFSDNSVQVLSSMHSDVYAGVVFTIVLCRRLRRRRPHCLSSLMTAGLNRLKLKTKVKQFIILILVKYQNVSFTKKLYLWGYWCHHGY